MDNWSWFKTGEMVLDIPQLNNYKSFFDEQKKIEQKRNLFKRILQIIIIFIVIVGLIIICANASNHTRTANARIVESGYTMEKYLLTEDGHMWDCDLQYPEGWELSVEFDTKGTKEIEDDVIIAYNPI